MARLARVAYALQRVGWDASLTSRPRHGLRSLTKIRGPEITDSKNKIDSKLASEPVPLAVYTWPNIVVNTIWK